MKKADKFNPGKWLIENKLTFQSKLNEGVIQLTSEERNQIEKMIPRIIDVIEKKYLKPDQFEGIGYINFTSADGTPGKVYVWVGNDMPSASGYHQRKDFKDLNDNYIVIQQNSYSPYFNVLWNTYSNFIGDKNMGIELLRKTLKHELIHAKDPAINQHVSPLTYKNYDSSKPELYYKSWIEFQTMTGQFFESIITGVDRIMKSDPSEKNVRKIEIALNDILNFYSGKSKTIKQETIDFIQNTDANNKNIFQKIITFVSKASGVTLLNLNAFFVYNDFISKIKKYHPEAYNEFLKDLYKTIDQCKDSINKALATSNRKGISLNKKL
jgi:hypothetical protein